MKNSKNLVSSAVAILAILFSTHQVLAQTPTIEVKENGFRNESELSIVAAHGNTRSQTTNIKQQNGYRWDDKNVVKAQYRFLRTKAEDNETAKHWDGVARYERMISELLSGYGGQGIESDRYAGIERRLNTDIGLKYILKKSEKDNWLVEAGYRYSDEERVAPPDDWNHRGRIYTEYEHKFAEKSAAKVWVEYLPNFSESEAYQINTEGSVTTVLTSILSLKVAYNQKYNNAPATPTAKYIDSLLTTSLVASF